MDEFNRNKIEKFSVRDVKEKIRSFSQRLKEKLGDISLSGESVKSNFERFFSFLETIPDEEIKEIKDVGFFLYDLQDISNKLDEIAKQIRDGDFEDLSDLDNKIKSLEQNLQDIIDSNKQQNIEGKEKIQVQNFDFCNGKYTGESIKNEKGDSVPDGDGIIIFSDGAKATVFCESGKVMVGHINSAPIDFMGETFKGYTYKGNIKVDEEGWYPDGIGSISEGESTLDVVFRNRKIDDVKSLQNFKREDGSIYTGGCKKVRDTYILDDESGSALLIYNDTSFRGRFKNNKFSSGIVENFRHEGVSYSGECFMHKDTGELMMYGKGTLTTADGQKIEKNWEAVPFSSYLLEPAMPKVIIDDEVVTPPPLPDDARQENIGDRENVVEDEDRDEETVRTVAEEPDDEEEQTTAITSREEEQQEEKLGFFARLKRKLFTKEGRQEVKETAKQVGKGLVKAAPSMVYKTVSAVLGIKLATDSMGLLVEKLSHGEKGWGDYANMAKTKIGRKELRFLFKEAYEEVLVENQTGTEVVEPREVAPREVSEKMKSVLAKIDSLQISDRDKAKLKEKLQYIIDNDKVSRQEVYDGVQKQVAEIIDTYTDNKLSAMTVLKDVLNLAGVATGLFALRGIAYAGTSIAERVRNTKIENKKKTIEGQTEEKQELLKDLFFNSTIETLRGLGFQGIKKDRNAFQRGTDFIKSLGTVLRGIGIYGVAFGDTDVVGAWNRFKDSLEEHGFVGTVSNNFLNNIERVLYIANEDENLKPQILEKQKEVVTMTQNMGLVAGNLMNDQLSGFLQSEVLDNQANLEIENKPEIFEVNVEKGGSALGTMNKSLEIAPAEFKELYEKNKSAFVAWQYKQLEEMGFKKIEGKWASPFTIHPGAELKVYKGTDGQWHARFDDTVTAKTESGREYDTIQANKTLHVRGEDVEELGHVPTKKVNDELLANNKRFFEDVQQGLSVEKVGDSEIMKALTADKTMAAEIKATGGLDSIRGTKFNEATGDVSVYIGTADGSTKELLLYPNKTDNGWQMVDVNSDLAKAASVSEVSTVESETGSPWKATRIKAEPKFFDESEVANRTTPDKVVEAVSVKSNATNNEVANDNKLVDKSAKIADAKDVDVRGEAKNTDLVEEKSKLVPEVDRDNVISLLDRRLEKIYLAFGDSKAIEWDEMGVSKGIFEAVKERITSQPEALSDQALKVFVDDSLDSVEKTRQLAGIFAQEGSLTELSPENKLFIGGDAVFNNSREFATVAVLNSSGDKIADAYLPIGKTGSAASHYVGLKMTNGGEYRFVSTKDNVYDVGIDEDGNQFFREVDVSGVEKKVANL